jgi:uncharacterized protein (DUF58 family)
VVFSDADIVEVRPQGRDVGATRVIREVVRQNLLLGQDTASRGNPSRLNEALRRAARLATHDWLVCLISDASGADDETTELVTRLTAHNDVLAVFVQDPLEEALPDIGKGVFASGDAQLEVDTASRTLRQRFSEERRGWRSSLADLSRNRAIPVLPISTDRDVADQLRELIGRRAGRPPMAGAQARR